MTVELLQNKKYVRLLNCYMTSTLTYTVLFPQDPHMDLPRSEGLMFEKCFPHLFEQEIQSESKKMINQTDQATYLTKRECIHRQF